MPNPDEQIRFPIDPEFMRPFVDETISVTLVVILGAVVPAIIVVVFNLLFVRDGHDLNHGIMGVGFALAMSTFWTDFLWLTIGGPRPKLIYQCDPDQAIVDALYVARKHPWSDYVYLYASEVCKNKIAGLGVFIWTPGFPSGHASNVFAGWIYVMLYIGAKVSAWSFSTGPTYKFVFTALPCVAIPVYVACTRILNHAHFPHQVVVGSLIGIVAAVAAYRLRYCSLFGLDAHIPNFYMTRGISDHEAPVKPLESVSIETAEKTENKNII
jgi:membrane-associated phospholipid phosphatase